MGSIASSTAEKQPVKFRRFCSVPGHFVVVLLAVEGILLLAERWIPKGWTVLIAIATIGVAVWVLLFWLAICLLFRWRFQFSLRWLLAMTVAVAIPFSWLAVEMKQAREQKATVMAIEKAGGSVDYDSANSPYQALPELNWLWRRIDSDFFLDVESVLIDDAQVDANLEYLKRLRRLRVLRLRDTDIAEERKRELREALPGCNISPHVIDY
jgi:hypothetical protein